MSINTGDDFIRSASTALEGLQKKENYYGKFSGSADQIKEEMFNQAITKIKNSVTGVFSYIIREFKAYLFEREYRNNPELENKFKEAATIVYQAYQYDQPGNHHEKPPSVDKYNAAVNLSLNSLTLGKVLPEVEQNCQDLRIAVIREKANIYTKADTEAWAAADKVREGDTQKRIEAEKRAWEELLNQK